MKALDSQLDDFAGEAAKPPIKAKRAGPFSSGQPIPGEEPTKAQINLRHWSALVSTNPDYTKPFKRGGGFSGTSVSPTWREMRMTEHFGPCGVGWGTDKPEFQLLPIEGNGELMVFCTVSLWFVENGKKSATVYGIGGDKVIARGSAGLRTSDEAFKSAYTDAMGNAMKRIGVAGDVHLGLFDDDKYQQEMRAAFAEKVIAAANEKPATTAPPAGNGPEPATLREKLAARTQQKRAAALTEMQPLPPDDDLPPLDEDEDDDSDDRVNLGRAQNIMLRQMAKAKIKEGIEAFTVWYGTLNQHQMSVCDRNRPIRAVVAEIKAAQGMRVLRPWWKALRVYEQETLDKAALAEKAHAADAARP